MLFGRQPYSVTVYRDNTNLLVHTLYSMALVPFLDEALTYPIFSIIAMGGAAFVGLLHGYIIGKAIVSRFDIVYRHAKPFSILFGILFLANALLSLPRFSSPDKIRLSVLFDSAEPSVFVDLMFDLIGVGSGLIAVLAISLTVLSLILLKIAPIRGAAKAFAIIVSGLVLVLTVEARFTYLSPSSFEILLYFMYQISVVAGVIVGIIRYRPRPNSI